MTDYISIWNRWIALSGLSKEDGITLVERIHEETRTGIEMISKLAADQMAEIFAQVEFEKKDEYLRGAESVLPIATLHGYCLFLISRQINPLTDDLDSRGETAKLGGLWIEGYRKDGNASLVE